MSLDFFYNVFGNHVYSCHVLGPPPSSRRRRDRLRSLCFGQDSIGGSHHVTEIVLPLIADFSNLHFPPTMLSSKCLPTVAKNTLRSSRVRTRSENNDYYSQYRVRHSEVMQLPARPPPSLDRRAATYATPRFASELIVDIFLRANTLLPLSLEMVDDLSSPPTRQNELKSHGT